jgi:Pvc16 N-terminal domain
MSAQFAIPATSFVLKALIEAQLKIAYGAFVPPKVSIEPPPRPAPTPSANAQPEAPGIILYMHHAGQNIGWRNMEVPYVETSGVKSTKTPLVLDLHYMLAATGADLEREALLGIAMTAFHRNGIVKRSLVNTILSAIAIPAPPTRMMDNLTAEPLANPLQHPESIKISQHPVDIDMSTKLWSALQSPIRPCAYYLVTTTVLETDDSVADGLPATNVRISGRPNTNRDADPLLDDVIVQTKALP